MDLDADDPFDPRPAVVGDGRFHLQGRIGAGGAAEVFRALDTQSDTECAIKIMQAPRGARLESGTRFLAEARAMSRIRHPHVVQVHAAGREGAWYWFAMDYAEGGSLWQHLRLHGPMDPGAALRMAFEVTSALSAVHALGLVHRDVKPQNVLLGQDGMARLADFGIARHPEGTAPALTRPGETMGTPGYRAPEQARDAHEVGPESDLYAVAATLWTALTGERPAGDWEGARVAPEIAAVLERATQADVTARYPTARELAAALAQAADTLAQAEGRLASRWMAELDDPARAGTRSEPPWTLSTWFQSLFGVLPPPKRQ
ncbi:MAG: serine/threonine protein kinase [Alphaproteobacteria bacterium]|nr:serine/threonine protein kinase [Alphaproteobacteria bacterium]